MSVETGTMSKRNSREIKSYEGNGSEINKLVLSSKGGEVLDHQI